MKKIVVSVFTLFALVVSATDFPVAGKTGADIQRALDAAAAAGGGRVVVPAGEYACASLRLRNHVELHLADGARLVGSTNYVDYFAFPVSVCAVRPENSDRVFVYAWDAEDIAITGKGVIDGRGPAFFDHAKMVWTFWAKPPIPRPRMVQFVRCRGVRLEGVTFKDSPGWTMLIRLCENVNVKGISIDADQRMINSDGIDFDGCRHVRVSDSRFKTGDDCLILRAMRETPEEHIVCEDVEVTDCTLDSACQTIRLGCPSDDVIRHATFRNIVAKGCNGIFADYPVRYLRPDDEGFMDISDITFDNYSGEFRGSAVQIIVEPGVKTRSIRDITFRNLRVTSAQPLRFLGNADSPLTRITLENVVAATPADRPYEAVATEPLIFRNCSIGGKIADQELVTPRGERQPLVRDTNRTSWEATKQKK